MSDPRDPRNIFFRALNDARLVDARAAVQAGLYINGLATTAILALLASLASAAMRGDAGGGSHLHIPHVFIWALGCFGAGVCLAALAAFGSYFTNHTYAELVSPFRSFTIVEQARRQMGAAIFHALTSLSCLGSLAAFVGGVTAVVIGFDRIA